MIPSYRSLRIALGAFLIVAGLAAVGYVEWRYLPATTKPLDVRLALDRAGTFTLPSFTIDRDGTYDIWLQVDRGAGLLSFGCLTAEPGFEKLCLRRKPELDLHWSLASAGTVFADGGTDIAAWQHRASTVPPPIAAAALHDFQAYARRTDNPSDATPFYHVLGTFAAMPGRLTLSIRLDSAAPTLATLNPRVIVGLTAAATARLGVWATLFCVLCVLLGGFMLLRALVPRKASP